jgi:hypothetical protein
MTQLIRVDFAAPNRKRVPSFNEARRPLRPAIVIRVDWSAWAVTQANMRAACGARAFLLVGPANDTHTRPAAPSVVFDRPEECLPGMTSWLLFARGRR